MTTYRSVKVILQNNTMEALIVTGAEAISGSWATSPSAGDIVSPNGSDTWTVASTAINTGAGAYITMITSNGYVIVSWQLPWVGPLEFEVKHPKDYCVEFRTYEEEPNTPVLMLYLWNKASYQAEFGKKAEMPETKRLDASPTKELTASSKEVSAKEYAPIEAMAEAPTVNLEGKTSEKKRN